MMMIIIIIIIMITIIFQNIITLLNFRKKLYLIYRNIKVGIKHYITLRNIIIIIMMMMMIIMITLCAMCSFFKSCYQLKTLL